MNAGCVGQTVRSLKPLRTRVIPRRLRGLFTTRRPYTSLRLPYLTCLYSQAARRHRPLAGTHCAYPQGMARMSWPRWLATYRDECPDRKLNSDTVTYPSTNRTRRRLTSLIETNSQTARWLTVRVKTAMPSRSREATACTYYNWPGRGLLQQAAELWDIVWTADNDLLSVCNVNVDLAEHHLHKLQPVDTLFRTAQPHTCSSHTLTTLRTSTSTAHRHIAISDGRSYLVW